MFHCPLDFTHTSYRWYRLAGSRTNTNLQIHKPLNVVLLSDLYQGGLKVAVLVYTPSTCNQHYSFYESWLLQVISGVQNNLQEGNLYIYMNEAAWIRCEIFLEQGGQNRPFDAVHVAPMMQLRLSEAYMLMNIHPGAVYCAVTKRPENPYWVVEPQQYIKASLTQRICHQLTPPLAGLHISNFDRDL